MSNFAFISLFLPLLSSIFAAIFSFVSPKIWIGYICSILLALSAFSSVVLLYSFDSGFSIVLKDFISVGDFDVKISFIVDEVSLIMMCVVGFVATVVHFYSIYYMYDDRAFNKFFAYLGLFVFAMLVLVMSDNFIGLFIGWEGVGLCSWLLIGFWYERTRASWAANEAFIMNRVADLAMLIGIFLVYQNFGSLNYADIFNSTSNINVEVLAIIGGFLFVGAMGKSAQFPFHTWLADAMEGPTPVSALIHAATMVTAGVYLVVRANSIFSLTYEIGQFIAYLGAFVAIFAALMALVNSDLKKIIAYSTLSQLGYMFVAAGLGAYSLALFHLTTHAFFKSLLFLCAGNVMHAMKDELNIKKMGGLFGAMKFSAIFMMIGSVALAGFYPFAGFFSKDKILEVAFNESNYGIYIALLIGAMMTAFYSFRLISLVFFGDHKSAHHPHEASKIALFSLIPLVLMSIFAGFSEHKFLEFVNGILPKYEFFINHETEIIMIVATLGLVTISTIFAIFAYKKQIFNQSVENFILYRILSNQYFIPQFYNTIIVGGYVKISKIFRRLDECVIDFVVDGIARVILYFSKNANKMQSGDLSIMLRLMVIGFMILLIASFLWRVN
jgi:proton-translocating NADH-quinone oxidoreductase, chain L